MRIATRQQADSKPDQNAGTAPQRLDLEDHARKAGWWGVVFAVLLVVSLLLVHRIPALGASDAKYKAFYGGAGADTLTVAGLYIVPFAGIACLWHMISTRTLLQVRRPQSWTATRHWLQLAACIVFVSMLYAGTAAAGAVALLTKFSSAPLPGPDVTRALSSVGYTLIFVYGVRAAGLYILTTTALGRSAGMLPKPVVIISYLAAIFLLLSTTFHPAVLLVFPGWVLLLSIVLLVHRPRGAAT
jgi:hypothetical protein